MREKFLSANNPPMNALECSAAASQFLKENSAVKGTALDGVVFLIQQKAPTVHCEHWPVPESATFYSNEVWAQTSLDWEDKTSGNFHCFRHTLPNGTLNPDRPKAVSIVVPEEEKETQE